MYEFKSELLLKEDRKTVFDFFKQPGNLKLLMPNYMAFDFLTPGKLNMKEGAVFDYNVKMFGFPIRWTTYITEYVEPNYFVDVQLKGPHKYWYHRHEFIDVEDGTIVKDYICYLMPWGLLGKVGHSLIMKHIIKSMFEYRKQVILKKFNN